MLLSSELHEKNEHRDEKLKIEKKIFPRHHSVSPHPMKIMKAMHIISFTHIFRMDR